MVMQFDSQTLDALGSLLGRLGQLGVLFQHTRQQSGLLGRAALTLFATAGDLLPVLSVDHRGHLVDALSVRRRGAAPADEALGGG